MNSEEAKRIVAEGLERRKYQRQEDQREAVLESYEKDQIRFCNANCADARLKRKAEEATRMTIEQAAARRAARAQEAARKQVLEFKAMAAVRYYACGCLAILLLTALTRLPLWAAAALALGLAVFPMSYIFRLYFPFEG